MKLVTYNIRYGLGKDLRYDLGRIAAAVADADVIALQEVERFWPRSGMADQPAELGALLPDHYWIYGPAFDVDASLRDDDGRLVNRRRQHGTMLMSRTPILSSRLHVLPKFATTHHLNMTMAALEGVIATAAGPLRVCSLHLNHNSRRERLVQIDAVLGIHRRAPREGGAMTGVSASHRGHDWSAGEPLPPMPADAILMGDFNAEPTSAEYECLVGACDEFDGRVPHVDGFVDAWVAAGNDERSGVTCCSDCEIGDDCRKRIDYCFVSAALADRVRGAWIDGDAQGSDHQPGWTDIDL